MSGKQQHDGGHGTPEHVERADEQARKKDPSGTGGTGEVHDHEPAARPTSDRHKTESAAGSKATGG
jgi:hypothetical protein